MRRKKDDKTILRRGNGRDNERNRLTPHLGIKNRNKNYNRNTNVKKQKKRSRKAVLLMILVLVAFIVGAAAGVFLSFDDGHVEKNETHYENVTDEMTTHVNESKVVVFEDDVDHIDYNENQSSAILDAEKNPYYNHTDETY